MFAEVDNLKKKIDIADNSLKADFQLDVKTLQYITADKLRPIVQQLGIPVEIVTLDYSAYNIWLKGDKASINQVNSIITKVDSAYNRELNKFYVYSLKNISAPEALKRLAALELDNVTAYDLKLPGAYEKLTKDILVACEPDFKVRLNQIIASFDVAVRKIKVPIDFSTSGSGEYRLTQRRDLLSTLSGIPVTSFKITNNVSRDDTLRIVMWVEETPENVQLLRELIARIDDPMGTGQ